jgi:formylglycine-generating enzyme required for sulfatase activity
LAVLLAAGSGAQASRVAVTNVTWPAAEPRLIRLDLSWDNSWRGSVEPANWDAVWLFAKVRVGPAGVWRHATLSTAAADYAVADVGGVAAAFSPSADGKGVFVYRQTAGRGPIRWTGVTLRWPSVPPGTDLEVRVFALEMVYVPAGPFYLGDGVSPGRFHAGGNPSQPALITDTPPRLRKVDGGLWAERQGVAANALGAKGPTWDKPTGVLPAAFPTGYAAFYIQKYEVTQGQYAAFLNTLAPRQAAARLPTRAELTVKVSARRRDGAASAAPPPTYRYTVALGADGRYAASAPDGACNYLSWEDATAFADWAALRPLSESEFEKACRGSTAQPVPGEYAWGSTRLSTMTDLQGIDGSGTETALPGDSNTLCQKSIRGPVRVGIHETMPTRELAGASHYGVLDLSGNVAEAVVLLSSPAGRGFTGVHGDGDLGETGVADVPLWPGRGGFGSRGGDWTSPEEELRVSARSATVILPARRLPGNGFRGVRSAISDRLPGK